MRRLIRVDGLLLPIRCDSYITRGPGSTKRYRCMREVGHPLGKINEECHWWGHKGHPRIQWIDASPDSSYGAPLAPVPSAL